jgi:serine phosphatase RsbU (regulator of sigma subunit)/anti-sigma regulatory factor (Ser/Thr protein kinase)
MFGKPVREINGEYRAEEKSLPSIQNMVRETCINAGLSRKDVSAVILAIEEGVTNIIRHAYLYEQGIVRIRIVVFKRRIVFSLIDNGRSFQPESGSKPDLAKLVESGRKGGLGFYMINKIMDSVEYLSTPGFNELRMTKLVSRQPERARLFMGRMFTLRVKFSLYTFFIMLVIIAGAFLFINNRTTAYIRQHLHDTVDSLGETIADQAGGYILNRRSDVEFDELVRSYLRANPELTMIILTDTAGVIIADTRDIRNLQRKYVPPIELSSGYQAKAIEYRSDGRKLHYLVNPVRSGDREIGRVHISYTGERLVQQVNAERRKIALITIIGLAIGIGGIYILSNYFVSPIVRIVERVRRFSSGDIETELPLEGVEEYFEISKALNEMMSRLRRDSENIVERERVAKEIEVAGQIQKTLLPEKLPEIPGLRLDAFYRAASRISGDLYDVFRIDDKDFCLLVADVSGKGIPASLIMSVLRTVIRIQSRGKTSSHSILAAVDDYIRDDIPSGIFITIFLGVYNVTTRKFNFVSAGHNPLIYLGKGQKEATLVNPPGVPLGLPFSEKASFRDKLRQQTLRLNEGDRLFVYSDGVTEAMNRASEKYGLERLFNIFNEQVKNGQFRKPREISELILSDIDSHCGLATQTDDITFITICSESDASDAASGLESRRVG